MDDELNGMPQDLIEMFLTIWGEVARNDIYRMRQLPWVPDIIYDIGANTGTFTLFSRLLFPEAFIFAVEPDEHNMKMLGRVCRIIRGAHEVVHAGLGTGALVRECRDWQGGNQVYQTVGALGYPGEAVDNQHFEPVSVKAMSLREIIGPDNGSATKRVLKIDCEGAENCIFGDSASMESMRTADYIAMELHWFAANGQLVGEVRKTTMHGIESLKETHDVKLEKNFLWATKR